MNGLGRSIVVSLVSHTKVCIAKQEPPLMNDCCQAPYF